MEGKAMNDDAFARLVAEEVKNRVSKTQRDFLHMPENWERWQRSLISLCTNLGNQIVYIESDQSADRSRYEALGNDGIKLLAEAMSDYEQKRSKIERFKFHVEKRLDDVTVMIASGPDSIDENIGLAVFLKSAIVKHHELLNEYDIEPTPVDQALWSSLEGKWLFDEIRSEDIN